MERLTERELNSVNNVSYCKCFFKGCNGQCATCDLQYEADMKLKEYEDLEEQGLLHKAPLKNGTPIWYFTYGFDEGTYLINTSYLFGVTEYEVGELGKDFWLSEEEAEAKLKELENE